MNKFNFGDLVFDKEGDIGKIVVPTPDLCGFVVWRCSERNTKGAIEGAYYTTSEDELELYRKCTNDALRVSQLEEFKAGVRMAVGRYKDTCGGVVGGAGKTLYTRLTELLKTDDSPLD